MNDLKYSEIIKGNKALSTLGGTEIKVSLLSNVMVHYWKDILEYGLRMRGFNPEVYLGDYDNILQESSNIDEQAIVCIMWELSNLIDGFEYKANTYTKRELDELKTKVLGEVQLSLENLKGHKLVLLNKFSAVTFRTNSLRNDAYMNFAEELNEAIVEFLPSNVKLIDLDSVIQQVSLERAINTRDYFSSKTLFTTDFFKSYTLQILPFFSASYGKVKKALIFDCDNTLWKGVLGEDGFDGIKMSANSPSGVPFEAVQHMAKELSQKGVIIGLCSKNNPEDVEQVIETHPDFVLTQDDIVIKKVNWVNKAANLNEIAQELNIGLESIVFVDDSDFEVNLVKEELSEVEVIQVPKKIHTYPGVIREKMQLFFNLSETKEDRTKTLMYKQQAERESAKKNYGSIEDFLASLELEIELLIDDPAIVPRVSQMTQKTNQFNFTTKRYTEQDIEAFYKNSETSVIAMNTRDKFGDNGITGLLILKKEGSSAQIDTLLMSCRVLGRNIEYKFIDTVVRFLFSQGIEAVVGEYLPTKKNIQVREVYEKFGFSLQSEIEGTRTYKLITSEYQKKSINYIKVKLNGREY